MTSSLNTSWQRLAVGLALTGALLAGAAGFTSAQDAGTPAASPTAPPVREVLVEASPADAEGQVLQLVRYDIPAGMVLPIHIHPGTQEAYIESGVLTYHVLSGGVIPVTRADGTQEELGLAIPPSCIQAIPWSKCQGWCTTAKTSAPSRS